MFHYIRFYNNHIYFFTLNLHKLFSLAIYILMFTLVPVNFFQLSIVWVYVGPTNIADLPWKIQWHKYVPMTTVTLSGS